MIFMRIKETWACLKGNYMAGSWLLVEQPAYQNMTSDITVNFNYCVWYF